MFISGARVATGIDSISRHTEISNCSGLTGQQLRGIWRWAIQSLDRRIVTQRYESIGRCISNQYGIRAIWPDDFISAFFIFLTDHDSRFFHKLCCSFDRIHWYKCNEFRQWRKYGTSKSAMTPKGFSRLKPSRSFIVSDNQSSTILNESGVPATSKM